MPPGMDNTWSYTAITTEYHDYHDHHEHEQLTMQEGLIN
jgi:hypothetical protein